MKIISDDKTLRAFIPNVFSTIDGELSLFDKLTPFLNIAETWFTKNILGESLRDEIAANSQHCMYVNVAMAITNKAFALAVPSLDVVLTPNGFGVVGNKTLVPASKERVERLIVSLQTLEAYCTCAILNEARNSDGWRNSPQCHWLAESIIQDMRILPAENLNWDAFIELRNKAYAWEKEIANAWISVPLMNRLRNCEATATYSNEEKELVKIVKSITVSAIKNNCLNRKLLEDTVTYIRASPVLFPEWPTSPTAKLFSDYSFKNKKDSSGYFF